MVMNYDPTRPLHDRYRVDHDFLTPEMGWEVVAISRLVNAFFLWEFNSCENIIKGEQAFPIDYANACPDVSLISLHYYFPWAIQTLAKWCIYCTVTGRRMEVDQDTSAYFSISDREDLGYKDKLRAYEELARRHFQTDSYFEFCAQHLPHADEVMHEYVTSEEFDRLLIDTVTSTFPAHEHEKFVAHYRGLVGAWAEDVGAPAHE
jgi:hypothetical protein